MRDEASLQIITRSIVKNGNIIFTAEWWLNGEKVAVFIRSDADNIPSVFQDITIGEVLHSKDFSEVERIVNSRYGGGQD